MPFVTATQIDKSIADHYRADLDALTDSQLQVELDDVKDRVDTETSWLEALCAERRWRSRDGALRILAERQRQVAAEGWTPEHDDAHSRGDLIAAAGCYAVHAGDNIDGTSPDPLGRAPAPRAWPFEAAWWKPSCDPVRDLEKAGALIAAEIDRLLRARAAKGGRDAG